MEETSLLRQLTSRKRQFLRNTSQQPLHALQTWMMLRVQKHDADIKYVQGKNIPLLTPCCSIESGWMRINEIQVSKHNNFLFQWASYYKILMRMRACIKPHLNYDSGCTRLSCIKRFWNWFKHGQKYTHWYPQRQRQTCKGNVCWETTVELIVFRLAN